MSETVSQPNFTTEVLTRELAEHYVVELTELANQIPEVSYSSEDILAEQKGERLMYGKWVHSLVVLDGGRPVAFVMGYERAKEGNDQYPDNTLYISELAVDKTHQRQGMAKGLLKAFFERNSSLGLQELDGNLNYSVQTNSADWNNHVTDLYKSFGFKQRAFKTYPNRTDIVLGVTAFELQLQ
jgi:ribosomal protein S18 acetylase RimI-like enzyme